MDLNNLPIVAEVDAELADPAFAGMTHGKTYAYNMGCKGPLCRKCQRDRMRAQEGRRGIPQPMDPYLEARQAEYMESLKRKPQQQEKEAI